MWLQRPETARGRRFPTARPQPGEAQPSEHKLTRPAQGEGKGRFQTVRQKKEEEEKKSSESDGSLAETKEDGATDREVERKREPLVREKDKRRQLLQEEVRREEEVEEESEGGQR